MALKTVLGKKILNDVIQGCSNDANKNVIHQQQGGGGGPIKIPWRILLVDHVTMRIISSCCKMHEIALEGILLVENINKKRQRFMMREAIYLISPTEESVMRLIDDFEDPTKPAYKSAHVFFIEVCPDELFVKISKSRAASYIKTIKEIEFSFLPYESQVFTLDYPEGFNMYYSDPPLPTEDKDMSRMAEQIATVCATLGEYPFVRYSIFGNSEKNNHLAKLVQKYLDIYKEQHVTTMGTGAEQGRSQLIILDRSIDCTSPVLHELTFQAMAYDLLNIQNDIYKISGPDGKEREITLDESNELWTDLRHKNIGTAVQRITSEIKNFRANRRGIGEGDAMGMKELSKLIKEVPQYQKDLKMYNTNYSLAEDCLKEQERIRLLCKIEQSLAMGTNEEGEKIKDYMNLINPVLLDTLTGVDEMEKLRVIILYILNQNGISSEKLNKLLLHGNIESLRSYITNLDKMGINVTNDSKNQSRCTQIPRKHKVQETFNIFSQWTPTVKEIMEDIIDDKLDRRNFPFLDGRAPVPGMRGQAVSARQYRHYDLNKHEQAVKHLPRLIVFMVGGVTFSEIRSAYEVTESKSWEVIIGSTHVITPKSFLEQVNNLSS